MPLHGMEKHRRGAGSVIPSELPEEGDGSFRPARIQAEGGMSDFGRPATDVREPRQVRKEATVASLSVCSGSTRSLAPTGFSIS